MEQIEQEKEYLQADVDLAKLVVNPETCASEYKYTWSDLAEIRSTILPTEMSKILLECMDNAMRHKKEADFWLGEAQKWLNWDKILK